jgi:hypothetical protein
MEIPYRENANEKEQFNWKVAAVSHSTTRHLKVNIFVI